MVIDIETPISFLKPKTLLDAEQKYTLREIALNQLTTIQDSEISNLVRLQKEAGLRIITDGAMRNTADIRDFWFDLAGVSPTVVISGHVFQDQNAGEVIPRVTGKIAANANHTYLYNFSFLQEEAGDGSIVRMDIPSPSLFLLDVVRNEWYDRDIYTSISDLANDISAAYNQTISDLYYRGCRRLLLIDRCWSKLCDRDGAKRLLQGGLDMTRLPDLLRRTNDMALAGLPDDMHIILYVPTESAIRKDCRDIVATVMMHERIDSFMIDLPESNPDFYDLLCLIPEGKKLILGVVDTTEPQLESAASIAERIAQISNHSKVTNVGITTKGGFVNNTDTIDFSAFTDLDQWYKIRLLGEISHLF